MENMSVNYLPIGTIVVHEAAPDVLFMIVGHQVENSANEQRDYVAVRYPVGATSNSNYFFFNHSEIKEIVHNGYNNIDHEVYVELLNTKHF